MRAVADDAGRRYLLLRERGDRALVRDPSTGDQRHLAVEALSVDPDGPLVLLTDDVSEPLPAPLDRAHGHQALGLLVELHFADPRPVPALLAETTLCESDLHGLVGDLRAAGLVREATVDGERGYRLTDEADGALAELAD